MCCTEIRHDAELHTVVSKVPYRAQTPIKSSKSLFTAYILDNAQDTDAQAESFDKTIGYENDSVTQIVEAIEDTCTIATLMELFPVVSENLEKVGFINTEGMDSIYANVSREEICLKLCLDVTRWFGVQNTSQMRYHTPLDNRLQIIM